MHMEWVLHLKESVSPVNKITIDANNIENWNGMDEGCRFTGLNTFLQMHACVSVYVCIVSIYVNVLCMFQYLF